MAQKDGMNYAPKGIPAPVVKKGEFPFAAVGLDHGHIYGMTNGLLDAGATLKWVYDPDPAKMQAFKARYPQVRLAESEEQVLADPALEEYAHAYTRDFQLTKEFYGVREAESRKRSRTSFW